ncbi:sigma factor [Emticicia sp.]|uniref:sigma factor n=1 Tax=Emticicia sp. TaxID=1930953 RepID=UPI003750ED87
MQEQLPKDFSTPNSESKLFILKNSEEQSDLDGRSSVFSADEIFIKQAFNQSPEKGCELLFRRYHRALCSHAVRYVYSKEIAEDIVSDVFAKFWTKKAYNSINSSYRFYLFRCVRNEAYSYLRSEFKGLDSLDYTEQKESSDSLRPDNITQYEESFNRVKELVEQVKRIKKSDLNIKLGTLLDELANFLSRRSRFSHKST